ncbi:hypothetical protein BS17DRAFT_690369, partial [Gyrodon lividus]
LTCTNIIRYAEINFCFSILQPVAGFWHFKDGTTKLKQVTGHLNYDVQHYIVAIISGPAPTKIVTAICICTLMDF